MHVADVGGGGGVVGNVVVVVGDIATGARGAAVVVDGCASSTDRCDARRCTCDAVRRHATVREASARGVARGCRPVRGPVTKALDPVFDSRCCWTENVTRDSGV